MTGTQRLAMIMRVQAVAFGAYGITLFLVPEFLLDTLFGWDNAEFFWARAVGASFLGITLLEWNIASRLETRMDLVWPFVAVPGLFVVGFLWSEFADELEHADGHEPFFWLGFAISALFFVVVAWARAAAER